ncbi:hypothetical protein DFH29DRAFT_929771 [Suillus ampliporus]|nr:hypothetical protein DFH29DRAFT_929771 [Suillus ampliporus]
MNIYTYPPVLVVGTGPVGLVTALTLLQDGIPVRIIDKDPNPRIGQRGPGISLIGCMSSHAPSNHRRGSMLMA